MLVWSWPRLAVDWGRALTVPSRSVRERRIAAATMLKAADELSRVPGEAVGPAEERLAEGLADLGGEAQLGNCKQRIEATCALFSLVGRKALRNQFSTVDS
jgi:hypothetical protein